LAWKALEFCVLKSWRIVVVVSVGTLLSPKDLFRTRCRKNTKGNWLTLIHLENEVFNNTCIAEIRRYTFHANDSQTTIHKNNIAKIRLPHKGNSIYVSNRLYSAKQ